MAAVVPSTESAGFPAGSPPTSLDAGPGSPSKAVIVG